ncbi:MAG: tetratricopeptide repeat protein [Desulfobulbaceae bacterium]|nr:tetratricopeptide repeat protein [Desulfobulbaceae bacterium]
MKQHKINEQQLQEMLHALPDREVPGELAERIMAEINTPRKTIRHLFTRLTTASITFNVQPLRIAGTVCTLAAVFWLGLIIGEHRDDTDNTTNTVTPSLSIASGNAEANHLMGRGLLAGGQSQQALRFLRQAALLAPQNPEYALWEGVVLGKESNKKQEREVYRKIIRQYPRYLPARMYLGHNLLETGQLEEALAEYNRVLALYPAENTALYNRALTCQLMGSRQQEAFAWKEYLQVNRKGKWAYRAVNHLNALGDFTYRSYQIGFRKIILNQNLLLGMDSEARHREIALLASSFAQSSGNVLNLVVFLADDANLAGRKATNLQHLVSRNLGRQTDKKIQISWFGKPENIRTTSEKQYPLLEGLLIFSQPSDQRTQEKMI